MHYYFKFVSSILQDALGSLGFSCSIGELSGEYCPGQYSIGIENKIKIAGIAQRIVANAVYVGGFIVVSNADLIKDILVPVYKHLDIGWDSNTVGSLENYKSDIKKNDVVEAIKDKLSSHYKFEKLIIDEELIQDARIHQLKYCN
jgi:lipoate-protein ligase A